MLFLVSLPAWGASAREYVVQVGAFRQPEGASALTQELKGKGYEVQTVTGDEYHRVVLGPFFERDRATASMSDLQQNGYAAFLRWDVPVPARPGEPARPAVPPPPVPVARAPEHLFVRSFSPPAPTAVPQEEPAVQPEIAQPVARIPEVPLPEVSEPPLETPSPVSVAKVTGPTEITLPPVRQEPAPPEPVTLPEPTEPPAPRPVERAALVRSVGLQVRILAGDRAVNNIKRRVAVEPVVQVMNRNDKAVAGAVLTFQLPSRGASGSFANGGRSMTVLTDRDGRASTEGLTINTVEGLMPIQVTASFEGETASTTIMQSNIRGSEGMSTGAKAAIFGAIAAGAVVGVVKAMGGEETPVAGPPIRATASVGTPTVSPP